MSGLDSWEDDPAAQETEEQRLAGQAQRMNLNSGAQAFQPGAAQAPTFQPGQQYAGNFQQYGGYNQQYGQYYQQQGYGGYPQYGQQQGFPQYNQGYGGSQQGYGHGQQQQQYGGFNPQASFQPQQGQNQQQQPRGPVQIAKRGEPTPSAAPAPKPAPASNAASGAAGKTLSISATGAPKVEKTGGTKVLSLGADTKVEKPAGGSKVLSLGSTTTEEHPAKLDAKLDAKQDAPAAGNKVVAAKAIEQTGESVASAGKAPSPSPSSGKNSPTRAEQRAAAEADAVAKEIETADVDQETLEAMYGKEHVNIIFLGHVDAGKSTLGGSILYATGMVDERTLDKYKREAKEQGRETWYLSWALDLTKEERSKGKTVEVGRGFFETEKRRYSILDAPGHKNYVPNMIGGASQADVGILVISARKGEYETGFERGGQTREHAMLAKTQGVNKLVVVINKMDDPTVEWSKARFDECSSKLQVFLKGVGYNPKTDIMFMPISAQTTIGIKDRVPKKLAPWYSGPSLLEYLDNMQSLERKVNAPFMMPVAAKYKDMGTMVEGRVEAGVIKKDSKLILMPNKDAVGIAALYGEQEDEIASAMCGDQIRIRLRGVEEEDILPGFVLCSPRRPVHTVSTFEAQIVLLELKSILSAGFNCVMHVHSASEEVTFTALLHKLEKGTNRKSKKAPGFAKKGMSIIARLEVTGGAGSVCIERFEDYPQMGRFTLRDQGQTIAIGKVTKLITDPAAA